MDEFTLSRENEEQLTLWQKNLEYESLSLLSEYLVIFHIVCRYGDTHSTRIRRHINAKVVTYWRLLLCFKIVMHQAKFDLCKYWNLCWTWTAYGSQIITLLLCYLTVMEPFIFGRQTHGHQNNGHRLVVLSRYIRCTTVHSCFGALLWCIYTVRQHLCLTECDKIQWQRSLTFW